MSDEKNPPATAPAEEEVVEAVVAEPAGDAPPVAMKTMVRTTDEHEPTGKWRDGMCDCCGLGCFHQSCLMGWCCPYIGIGQVLSRVKLLMTGDKTDTEGVKKQFYFLCIFTAVIIVCEAIGNAGVLFFAYIGAGLGVLGFIFVFLTRMTIRGRDKIPADCCGCDVVEDFCASCCCTCCVACQLMRHTANYKEDYPGSAGCFTYTGLPVDDSVV